MTVPMPPMPGAPVPGRSDVRDPTAVMGRRTVAWLVDLLLFLAVVLATFAGLAEYISGIDALGGGDEACDVIEARFGSETVASCIAVGDRAYVLSDVDAAIQSFVPVAYLALFVIVQGALSASPGKLLLGLRVVGVDGGRIGLGRSLGRTLLWIVDAAPWVVPLVGPIVAFTSTGHRRIGDMAARTHVVSVGSVGVPIDPAAAPVPEGQSAWGAPPPVTPAGPPTGDPWSSGTLWGNDDVTVTPPTDPQPSPTQPLAGPPEDPAAPGQPVTRAAGSTSPYPTEADHRGPADLDISSLEVPPPTERADVAPPVVEPDPDWYTEPDATPPGQDPAPEDPLADGWSPGGLPDEPSVGRLPGGPADDPTLGPDAWQPPTSPFADDDEPVAGGPAGAPADPGPLTSDGRVPEAVAPADEAAGDDPGARGPDPVPFTAPGADAPTPGDPGVDVDRGPVDGGSVADPGARDPWGSTATPGDDTAPVRYALPPPQWDQARGTYLQWDPNAQAWLEWDTVAEHWKPINT